MIVASLVFLTPANLWADEEIKTVATILSSIACELLKGEHRYTRTIEIESATGRPVAL